MNRKELNKSKSMPPGGGGRIQEGIRMPKGATDKLKHAQGLQTPPRKSTKKPLAKTPSHANKGPILWAGMRGPCTCAWPNSMTGLLGKTLGFAWCCKTQEILSAKMENQNKMLTLEENVHKDNKEKGIPKKAIQTRRTGQWV